ncbi:g7845 [Coccomyxa elongata]
MGSLTNAQIHVVEPAEERAAQKSYWADHSATASVEAMMLDSQAAVIDKEERPEVLAMLGCVEGARIVELGAGIGRFTGELAATARSVLAVDFMENLIEENRRANGHRRNVRWQVGDATELQLPAGCADVVFSNWLLMYLSDAEVGKLAGDALTWVVEGGTVFFRESCFRQSGDKARKNNPTHYRNPRDYFAIFDNVETREADGRYAHFELVSCKCVDTYVRIKKNQNQICWKWQKVVTTKPIRGSFRAFLDTKQYKLNGILRYERIFGPGFVSTGGLDTTKEFVDMLALKPDERVLDVGCGIGGGDFYMAAKFGAFVHGVDLSVNMVTTALERTVASVNGQKVSFEIADITTCEMAKESYDVVYSRDTILHIHDKPALFQRFMDVLKPGGRLLISDYCRAPGTPSDAFAEYIAQRGYDLHSVDGYRRMLADAGFVNVKAEDRTWQFEACLRKELETAKAGRDDFVRDFSAEDNDAIVSGWQDKLVRVGQGEQRWGLFLATKPV